MAAVAEAREAADLGTELPEMTYRRLGRTGFNASRLIFGAGATLARGPADGLLDAAFSAGINVFDVGTSRYYPEAERNLAPFLKKTRDRIFLISKSPIYLEIEPDEQISVQQAKSAAEMWLEWMDESLGQLGVDHVDAYYMMAAANPSIVASDEIYSAFLRAKKAGKVSHLGLSTHKNAQAVLETAIETGRYDLAMIAVTPAGWYDWENRRILQGTPDLVELQPLLARAREAGIGLIGMKACRYLAGRGWFSTRNRNAFDEFYAARLLNSTLTPFQRSYAYVLEHGLDVVNADMRSQDHLRQNLIAAATAEEYFDQPVSPRLMKG